MRFAISSLRGALVFLFFWLGGCDGLDTGPRMQPGNDCLACHSEQAKDEKGPPFSIGGTVFPSASAAPEDGIGGVIVRVTDANGAVVTMYSNGAGNFYWSGSVPTPLRHAEVERDGTTVAMTTPPTGACNSCHTPGGVAQGRIHAP